MLGQPISMQLPEVIWIKIEGKLNEGITATDTVLFLTEKCQESKCCWKICWNFWI